MTKKLDLCVVIDTTASMKDYLNKLKKIVGEVVAKIGKLSSCVTRFALVQYRDHKPHFDGFVTDTHKFTSLHVMQTFIDSAKVASPVQDGDFPEAVADALNDVNNLDWQKEAVKICILITDAPPHGLIQEGKDNHPDGCPDRFDPMILAKKITAKGITLHVIGCEPAIDHYKEWYSGLAYITGGLYIPLAGPEHLSEVILAGYHDVQSMDDITPAVEEEFHNILRESVGKANPDQIAEQIYKTLKPKWIHESTSAHKGLFFEPTGRAIEISKFKDMAECKNNFQPYQSQGATNVGVGGIGREMEKKERTREERLRSQVKRIVPKLMTKLVRFIHGPHWPPTSADAGTSTEPKPGPKPTPAPVYQARDDRIMWLSILFPALLLVCVHYISGSYILAMLFVVIGCLVFPK